MQQAQALETSKARPVIAIDHLNKTFDTISGERVHALDDICLTVQEREFVTIVGPSGCGKSTLLKILAGLTPSSSGSVTLDDTPITAPRRDFGIEFQHPVLLP
jgi:NitT/TauT family transport system ATP-binding protein